MMPPPRIQGIPLRTMRPTVGPSRPRSGAGSGLSVACGSATRAADRASGRASDMWAADALGEVESSRDAQRYRAPPQFEVPRPSPPVVHPWDVGLRQLGLDSW